MFLFFFFLCSGDWRMPWLTGHGVSQELCGNWATGRQETLCVFFLLGNIQHWSIGCHLYDFISKMELLRISKHEQPSSKSREGSFSKEVGCDWLNRPLNLVSLSAWCQLWQQSKGKKSNRSSLLSDLEGSTILHFAKVQTRNTKVSIQRQDKFTPCAFGWTWTEGQLATHTIISYLLYPF